MPSPSSLSASLVYFAPIYFLSPNFTLANPHARSIDELATVSNENPTVQSSRLLTAVASTLEQFSQTLSLRAVNTTLIFAGIILVVGVMASGQSQVPGMTSIQNIEELFSLPSRDHNDKIIQVPIYKLKVDGPEGLKAWCRAFRLKTSLKKAGLQEELIKFSNSQELWALSRPGAQRPHKGSHGPKPGTKKAVKLTGSRKRQHKMFSSATTNGNAGTSASDSDENPDILAWADTLSLKCPSYYKPRPPRKSKPKPKTISSNEQLVQDLHSVQKTVNVIASYIIPDPNLLASIPSRALPAIVSANPLHAADSMSSLAALPAQSFPLPTVDVFQLPALPIPLSSMDVDQSQPHSSNPSSAMVITRSITTPLGLPSSGDAPAMPSINLAGPIFDNAQVKKLALARGKVLIYTRNDVPDRPALRFSKNLVRLRKIWDDDLVHEFDPRDCPLKVNGIPIALKYWDRLYSHECHDKSDKRWRGYKSQWHEWKYVAEYLLARTTDEFWKEFTDLKTGQRMSYTAIRRELRRRRNSDEPDLQSEDESGGE